MGEIADMMLDGFLDEETGEVIDFTSPGFPRRMSDPSCYIDRKAERKFVAEAKRRKSRNPGPGRSRQEGRNDD